MTNYLSWLTKNPISPSKMFVVGQVFGRTLKLVRSFSLLTHIFTFTLANLSLASVCSFLHSFCVIQLWMLWRMSDLREREREREPSGSVVVVTAASAPASTLVSLPYLTYLPPLPRSSSECINGLINSDVRINFIVSYGFYRNLI